MKTIVYLMCIALTSGCVYDPVNYAKQHDRDFNDHLNQMGDGGGGDE